MQQGGAGEILDRRQPFGTDIAMGGSVNVEDKHIDPIFNFEERYGDAGIYLRSHFAHRKYRQCLQCTCTHKSFVFSSMEYNFGKS